jgi:hypothetical protein
MITETVTCAVGYSAGIQLMKNALLNTPRWQGMESLIAQCAVVLAP